MFNFFERGSGGGSPRHSQNGLELSWPTVTQSIGHAATHTVVHSHHSHTGFSDESAHPPLSVLVQHLKDHPYDKTDEVMKATAMEVVATIKVN